ncbi:hypothetical protein [Methylorubrum zatmanii]|uniref:Uncharacterized protein n=1 Tax=Methylorubrum zatmanii TaxID=29429 RepID=A0ABW1WHY1_9HYPH|nr:hypothetical protein [Methylorubrum zatmanii]
MMLVTATGASAKDTYSDYRDYLLDSAPRAKAGSKKYHNSKSFLDEHLATVRRGDCDVVKPGNHLTGGYRTGSGGWVLPSYTTHPGVAPSNGPGPSYMPGGASRGWNETNPFAGGLGTRR